MSVAVDIKDHQEDELIAVAIACQHEYRAGLGRLVEVNDALSRQYALAGQKWYLKYFLRKGIMLAKG